MTKIVVRSKNIYQKKKPVLMLNKFAVAVFYLKQTTSKIVILQNNVYYNNDTQEVLYISGS